MIIIRIFFVTAIFLSFYKPSHSIAGVNAETQKAATQLGANAVTEIKFVKGSDHLSQYSKEELRELIKEIRLKGPVKEISVVAWADYEYPQKDKEMSKTQINLADKRAEHIQNFLEHSLNISGVHSINMASRPNALQELFSTTSAKTKDALEKTGAAPTTKDGTGFLGLKGKSSEAVIFIYQ